MASVTDCHWRTSHRAEEVEREFRAQLRARGADPERFWISFRHANAEDRESSLRDYGLDPTVTASVQPPRGQSDGELDAAILATAHELGAAAEQSVSPRRRGGRGETPRQNAQVVSAPGADLR